MSIVGGSIVYLKGQPNGPRMTISHISKVSHIAKVFFMDSMGYLETNDIHIDALTLERP